MRLAGKRCLIVGGTSGIGLAAVRQFLTEGAQVAAVGLPTPPAPPSIPGARVIKADATQPGDVEALFADAISFLCGLDVVYHVYGGGGGRGAAGAPGAHTDSGT